ncbi:MAG TPA: adventurous gliding motility protein CglE [Anaeromyxobacter sp.]|nr:adventurous gliding motility protein CglE [Anaeromyxobacter sp.]
MKPLAALALLLPAVALAQDAAPQLQEDPRAAKFKDVERGFFVGFEAGYQGWLDTPAPAKPEDFPLAGTSGGSAGGLVVGALVGVDLGSRLSIAVFAQGGNAKADPNYGAFSLFAAGGDVKLAVLGRRDRNDWERLYLYVHARGGFARSYPEGLFGTSDVLLAAGPGVEYFTRLRHFSIALGADFVRATKAGANGFTIYPTVRYTF